MSIPERLKELRKKAGISQQELAVRAGLSVSVVSQIEQGRRTDPAVSTAMKLAEALGVSLDELVKAPHERGGEPPKKPRGGKKK